MSQYFEVVGVSSSDKELEEVAENEGIRVLPLEMKRHVSLLNDCVSLFNMYKLIRNEKPDIIHTHTPKAGMVGMIAGWLARVPVRLHTVAGLPLMEVNGMKRIVLNTVEKLTYASATKVYPNSHGLMDYILQQKFCSPGKLKVIANGSSNGIDTTFFSPEQVNEYIKAELKKKLKIESGDFVFVFIGRLVKDKGINELVSAFTVFNKIQPLAKLLLVGNREDELDPLSTETETSIEKNKSIIAAGYQKDVRPYLAVSDALVFPSYREGFPNVVMQAGAMGLPSIVSDINGCNEIIVERQNGLIIPVKNEIRILDAMKYLYNNTEEKKQMAVNARKMIINRYEQSIVWGALLSEYQSLVINRKIVR